MLRLLPVLIFCTLLFSCGDDDDNLPTPSSEDYIRATLDGEPYESEPAATAFIVYDGTNSDGLVSLAMTGTDAIFEANQLTVVYYGTVEPEEQSYSNTYEECLAETNPQCVLLSYFNTPEDENDKFSYSNEFPGTDAAIEFQSIKFEPDGFVEATFSGTIRDEYSNDVIEVENGKLRMAIEE